MGYESNYCTRYQQLPHSRYLPTRVPKVLNRLRHQYSLIARVLFSVLLLCFFPSFFFFPSALRNRRGLSYLRTYLVVLSDVAESLGSTLWLHLPGNNTSLQGVVLQVRGVLPNVDGQAVGRQGKTKCSYLHLIHALKRNNCLLSVTVGLLSFCGPNSKHAQTDSGCPHVQRST